VRYDERMKSNPKTSETPFQNFTRVMDGLMRVPHSAIKKELEREKQEKADKKRSKTFARVENPAQTPDAGDSSKQ